VDVQYGLGTCVFAQDAVAIVSALRVSSRQSHPLHPGMFFSLQCQRWLLLRFRSGSFALPDLSVPCSIRCGFCDRAESDQAGGDVHNGAAEEAGSGRVLSCLVVNSPGTRPVTYSVSWRPLRLCLGRMTLS
jgi:hypothetical protein